MAGDWVTLLTLRRALHTTRTYAVRRLRYGEKYTNIRGGGQAQGNAAGRVRGRESRRHETVNHTLSGSCLEC